jgi:hypothetical protein
MQLLYFRDYFSLVHFVLLANMIFKKGMLLLIPMTHFRVKSGIETAKDSI